MSPAWITTLFCPILGDVISNIMFATSLPAILKARKKNDIGNINPVPYGVTVMNCVGWSIYGVMQRDFFIFFGNMPGAVLAMFYSMTCLVLLARRGEVRDLAMYRILEALFLGAIVFWGIMGMVVGIAMGPSAAALERGSLIVGLIVSGCGLAYYVAPLSTVKQVIMTRNASSLYAPMIIMNLINALLWFVYGFVATSDIFVWGPNAVGITLACIQLSLVALFRSNTSSISGMQAMQVSTADEMTSAANPIMMLSMSDIEAGICEPHTKECGPVSLNPLIEHEGDGLTSSMWVGAGAAGASPIAATALTHATHQQIGTPGDPYAFTPLPGGGVGIDEQTMEFSSGLVVASSGLDGVSSTIDTTVSALHAH